MYKIFLSLGAPVVAGDWYDVINNKIYHAGIVVLWYLSAMSLKLQPATEKKTNLHMMPAVPNQKYDVIAKGPISVVRKSLRHKEAS